MRVQHVSRNHVPVGRAGSLYEVATAHIQVTMPVQRIYSDMSSSEPSPVNRSTFSSCDFSEEAEPAVPEGSPEPAESPYDSPKSDVPELQRGLVSHTMVPWYAP